MSRAVVRLQASALALVLLFSWAASALPGGEPHISASREFEAKKQRIWARNCCICRRTRRISTPIEKAWPKLKPWLRAAKARTAEALEQALAAALKTIAGDNAAAWFRHSG